MAAAPEQVFAALEATLVSLKAIPAWRLPHFVPFVTNSDPLHFTIVIMLVISFLCLVFSWITGNHSQVDRFWSLAPGFYVSFFAIWPHILRNEPWDARLLLMQALVTLWGARLTYNFARKGGYSPSAEDYRWPVLRKKLTPMQFELLNITFIAFYQNVLLLMITLPAYVAWRARGTPLNIIDILAAALFLALWTGEVIADEQQWRFQTEKYALIAKKARLPEGDLANGFFTSGLFKYSRHPNFFCEISLWFAFALFSVAASGVLTNWSWLGAIQLLLLFQGSTTFTEQISSAKYPAYKEYQKTTSRLIPWFPAQSKKRSAAPAALKKQTSTKK